MGIDCYCKIWQEGVVESLEKLEIGEEKRIF